MKKFFKFITAAVIIATAVVSCSKDEKPDVSIEKSLIGTEWTMNIDLEVRAPEMEHITTLNFCDITFEFRTDSTAHYSIDMEYFIENSEEGEIFGVHSEGDLLYRYNYPTVSLIEMPHSGSTPVSSMLLLDDEDTLVLTMTKDYKYLELDKKNS